ncbi:MAG: DUF4974 domain-containing protein [Bacteroidales bacterium]|nr:DUF4974 domain-containing protein [Bacteroidales bacterium]
MSEENLKIADILFAYIKGTISECELEELTKWVEAAEEHRELFQQIVTSVSYQDKEAVYRRFDSYYDFDRLRGAIRGRKRGMWKYVAAAAVIALPLLVSLLLQIRQEGIFPEERMREISLLPGKSMATLTLSDGSSKALSPENFDLMDGSKRIVNDPGGLSYQVEDTSECMETAYNEITVPRGGEYKVTLDDGTRIWVNSESYIRFPVVFHGDERRIWVSGEVFLEVTKDSERPFVVNTEKLDIKVLGTRFNVRAYPDEKCIQTTLVEGRVQVDNSLGKVTVLAPSEQLLYNAQNGKHEVREVDTELYVSWKDGVYVFVSQRLEDIMLLISKWYDVDVFYQNSTVKDIIFSGRLKRYENAETLLKVFERLGGVRFSIQGKTVIVEDE